MIYKPDLITTGEAKNMKHIVMLRVIVSEAVQHTLAALASLYIHTSRNNTLVYIPTHQNTSKYKVRHYFALEYRHDIGNQGYYSSKIAHLFIH